MPQKDDLYRVVLSLVVTVHAKNKDEAESAAKEEALNEVANVNVGDLNGLFEVESIEKTKED